MTKDFDFDLFVIGAGSGGVRAARMAAEFGAKVGIAEEKNLGGTCVNVGCVPKKLLVYGSHFAEEFADAVAYGWSVEKTSFDWTSLRDNKNKEIFRLNGVYESLLQNSNVEIFSSHAEFHDHHTLTINGTCVSAEKILIATGSAPFVPPIAGSEYAVTSNDMFHLDQLPKRMTVVGGGYIAVEFAGIMNGLGVETTLVYRGSKFLRGFDQDIRRIVVRELEEKGIRLQFNSTISKIEKRRSRLELSSDKGSTLSTDLVLYATGRKPHVQSLGLDNTQIRTGATGAIEVNDVYQTTVPNVFALGDVIDRAQLTPVAIAEGMAFAQRQFNQKPGVVDYSAIPTCVFCQPNIGTVGPTEEEARHLYSQIEVFESSFKPMKHTMTGRNETTYMKLIVDVSTDKLISAHMVGPEAGEIIQGFAVAITAGATKADVDRTIAIHPTTAEEFVTMRDPKSY
ncbi:MAG: glutathione-disulfide reductase [Gammaproteobacteria bacterium]|nr:glutathione-disulfide reductase [Gammaproteobacteria bacterium]